MHDRPTTSSHSHRHTEVSRRGRAAAGALGGLGLVVVFLGSAAARAQTVCPYATVADCPPGYNRVEGTSASETVNGTEGDDCILGMGGSDIINGLGGNDILCGHTSTDTLNGGPGDDILYGGSSGDILNGDEGDDILYGGVGTDTLNGGDGNDILYGENGVDTLYGGAGNDYLDGGGSNDITDGGSGTDVCPEGGSGCESLTPVALVGMEARAHRSGVIVTWRTAAEAGTLAFELRRRGEDGVFRRVGESVVAALHDSPLGGTYRLHDPRPARAGERVSYELVEHAAGAAQVHGPFELVVAGGEAESGEAQPDARTPFVQQAHELARQPRQVPRSAPLHVRSAFASRSSPPALKIAVTHSGLYRLSVAELAAYFDVPEEQVGQWLARRELALSSDKEPVAWWSPPREPGLVFYGREPSSIYATRHVYYLRIGPGSVMERAPAQPPPPGGVPDDPTFMASSVAQEDRFAGLVVEPDPESDYWFWAVLVAGVPGREAFSAPLTVEQPSSSGQASLRLRVHGASAGTHRLSLHVGGVAVGEASLSGMGEALIEQTFAAASLVEGDNSVEVRIMPRSVRGPSIVYVDRLELRYPRRLRVTGGQLAFEAHAPTAVEVSDRHAHVFDVSEPRSPRVLVGVAAKPSGGGAWELRLSAPSGGARLAVVQEGGWSSPAAVQVDTPSSWSDPSNSAEYVVIAPAAHVEQAERLARHRARGGLSTAVVRVDDIYDELGDGTPSPHALRAFLAHAVREWSIPPRYVVLAGLGSYDYRDVLGAGESLVPTFMIRTGNGLYSSDARLADVVGDDGVADLALGRLPARSPAELEQMVDKLIAYEEALTGAEPGRLALAADARDGALDFAATGDDLLTPAAPWSSERIYRDVLGAAETRARLRRAFGDAGIVSYLGHGSVAQLGKRETLLASSDVAQLPAAQLSPLVLAMTCTMGRFELPAYTGLAEALVSRADGGAIAVLSASALSEHGEATRFLAALLAAAGEGGAGRLGDVVLAAQARLNAERPDALATRTYNLLGDPALSLRPLAPAGGDGAAGCSATSPMAGLLLPLFAMALLVLRRHDHRPARGDWLSSSAAPRTPRDPHPGTPCSAAEASQLRSSRSPSGTKGTAMTSSG